MSLQLDFLTTIVNVNWDSGGVFVAGDASGGLHYIKIEDEGSPPETTSLGRFDFTISGRVHVGSYALIENEDGEETATFVVGGYDGSAGSGNVDGIIMVSNDGREWELAKRITITGGIQNRVSVIEMTWDREEKAFYAGTSHEQLLEEAENTLADVLYKSTDGHTWNQVGRRDFDIPEVPVDYESLCSDHFTGPENLTDGAYGYQETRDEDDEVISRFVAIPVDPMFSSYTGGVIQEGLENKLIIKITEIEEEVTTTETKTITVPGFDRINGVAYAGDVLVVGGRDDGGLPVMSVSFDQGNTWEELEMEPIVDINPALAGILPVIGAPANDIMEQEEETA